MFRGRGDFVVDFSDTSASKGHVSAPVFYLPHRSVNEATEYGCRIATFRPHTRQLENRLDDVGMGE